MFKLHLNPFFSPDDSATIESNKMSISDMAEYLAEDNEPLELDPDKSEDSEDSEEEESEETEKEAKSLEDELEEELKEDEPETDDDEVVMPVRRKEVLAKYPNIFKEFPHLDKAVYREQKYSEILPSLNDAKLAVEKSETLDRFSEELGQGKTTTILQAVKEENPAAFNSLVDGYLDQLQTVDKGAYFHVLGNVIKHTIIAMANSEDNDDKIAAKLINKFVFGSDKFTPPTRLSQPTSEKNEDVEKLEQERQSFRREQLDTHVKSVNTKLDNSIKSAIDKNIDPRGSMNNYVKERAIRDCSEKLDDLISRDTRFKGILDKLWEKAGENNFSEEFLDRIRTAYWSKAKGILPDIIRKVRADALKGQGNKSPSERHNPLPVGRPSSSVKRDTTERRTSGGNTDKDKAKALPKGTKSIDYLMRD